MEQTLFQVKCEIMSQMFDKYFNQSDDLELMFAFNNLGFPLAWAYAHGYANLEASGVSVIEETWDYMLDWCGKTEDTGFTKLSEIYSE